MASFDNIKQALKRANHFAPKRKDTLLWRRVGIARRRNIQQHLTAVGIPNGLLLWQVSDDYRLKLMTIDDIARGINRFIDNNRAADNVHLAAVLRWWRELLFFDPALV